MQKKKKAEEKELEKKENSASSIVFLKVMVSEEKTGWEKEGKKRKIKVLQSMHTESMFI